MQIELQAIFTFLFPNQYTRHSISFTITMYKPCACSSWFSHNF